MYNHHAIFKLYKFIWRSLGIEIYIDLIFQLWNTVHLINPITLQEYCRWPWKNICGDVRNNKHPSPFIIDAKERVDWKEKRIKHPNTASVQGNYYVICSRYLNRFSGPHSWFTAIITHWQKSSLYSLHKSYAFYFYSKAFKTSNLTNFLVDTGI